MEKEFIDKFRNIIKLTDKQWSHIVEEHPEVQLYKNRLSEVLSKPDLVKRSKRNKDIFYTTVIIKIYTKVSIY